jgi:branched-chain amino acid transport system ATP-binding protein
VPDGPDHGVPHDPARALPQRPCVLRVRGLVAGYGDLAAVRGVDLELRAGEVVALLGPNGAGKTTTLLTLAGELPKIAGEVHYMDRPFKGPLHQRVRRGLAFVPEERSVFMGLSVADNLKIGGHTARVLALFPELEPLLGRRAGLLSGGEQQMLSLSRGLVTRPKLIIADEMSLGLAPKMVDMVFDSLGRLKAAGVTMIIIEQFVHRALAFADQCVLLSRGQVAWQGAPGAADREILVRYLGESTQTSD